MYFCLHSCSMETVLLNTGLFLWLNSVARMLHVETTSFSISFSVLLMKYFLVMLVVGFHVFGNSHELCLGNAGVVQVLCRDLRTCNTVYFHLIFNFFLSGNSGSLYVGSWFTLAFLDCCKIGVTVKCIVLVAIVTCNS